MQFSDAVERHRRETLALINCAERLVDRLPRFRQIDASRIQAYKDISSQPRDNILDDADKLSAWREEKRRVYEVAEAVCTKNWKAIARFQDKVRLKFGELSHPYSEGEGAGYKLMTARESEALQSEMFIRYEIGLGGSLSSTLDALKTAIRLINEASLDPSGHPQASLTAGSENPRGPIPEGPVENARGARPQSIAYIKEHWTQHGWPARLKQARLQHGHTHKEAADACGGANHESYRKWESGKRRPAERFLPKVMEYIESAESGHRSKATGRDRIRPHETV